MWKHIADFSITLQMCVTITHNYVNNRVSAVKEKLDWETVFLTNNEQSHSGCLSFNPGTENNLAPLRRLNRMKENQE